MPRRAVSLPRSRRGQFARPGGRQSPLWISRQILREYLASLSRPGTLTSPVSMTTLITDIRSFETGFFIAEDGPGVTSQLLNLPASIPYAGKQVHDANIVATMLALAMQKLLTHNVADFH